MAEEAVQGRPAWARWHPALPPTSSRSWATRCDIHQLEQVKFVMKEGVVYKAW
ncbi:hypothetical protein ACI48D_08045 [Massilia sp. LXY-6]|uniref:hypothetical protein n=1 Tax=Massilia sp. LXY-6 TaxID=3379823 RepID=UPI003EE1A102